MFNYLALATLLLAGVCHAQPPEPQHYYIFGDSLSSPTGCEWPLQLKGAIHNYAQAALTLKEFALPHHFKSRLGGIAVIYIGTNDAVRSYGAADYKRQLRELVSRIRFRGIVQVYIIGQPYLDVSSNTLDTFRLATIEVAREVNAKYLDPGWGTSSTIDGVHPSCIGNVYLGAWIAQQLQLESGE